MPFLSRPQAEIYYELNGSGPAVVFAHGLGGNHMTWWQQVPGFSQDFTCVTFAHRGFNPSREAPQGPGAAAFVDDLEALIDKLELSNVALVAQSMGGWACLEYSVRHPDNVRALVMAATVGGLDHPELSQFRATQNTELRARLARQGIHVAAGERMARGQPALHFLYKEVNNLSWDLDKEALREQLGKLRNVSQEEVANLRVPMLCVVGEEDAVIPPDAVRLLSEIAPNARFEVVPRSGHSVYWERPEVFNTLVGGFIRQAK